MYSFDELLSYEGATQKQLVDYAFQVLDAMGVKNGPGHLEIMLTDRGPVLIEMGARIIGGDSYALAKAATGTSPIELTIEAYMRPEQFARRLQEGAQPLERKKFARMVQLISVRAGTIKSLDGFQDVKSLPSVMRVKHSLKVGDAIPMTVDLATSPGQILLVNENLSQLLHDYDTIRKLEKEGLIELY
jgi:biotin carboxylase